MKKALTKNEIVNKYKQNNPLFLRIFICVFGLIFEVGVPAIVLICAVATKNILLAIVFPLVLGIGLLLFRGILFSTIKEAINVRTKYRIVLAKCVDEIHIEHDDETPDEHYWVFKTDDHTIKHSMGVRKGDYGYLIVVDDSVIAVFNANKYDTNEYQTTFYCDKTADLNKKQEQEKASAIFAKVLLEYTLACAIALDIAGCCYKEWVIALSSGLLMIFYLLGSLLGHVHTKATGIIAIVYLFANGSIFYYLSFAYNHSVAAYIVGTVFILLSLLIGFTMWSRK